LSVVRIKLHSSRNDVDGNAEPLKKEPDKSEAKPSSGSVKPQSGSSLQQLSDTGANKASRPSPLDPRYRKKDKRRRPAGRDPQMGTGELSHHRQQKRQHDPD
ncbi:hypothetical protein, partial [Bradyrhizobium sp.]|uniref:hypothetical protein n=1 Tax=Bradyrhizobium sp. TaxID=376 RepID=UPI0026096726